MGILTEGTRSFLAALLDDIQSAYPDNVSLKYLEASNEGQHIISYIHSIHSNLINTITTLMTDESIFRSHTTFTNIIFNKNVSVLREIKTKYYNNMNDQIQKILNEVNIDDDLLQEENIINKQKMKLSTELIHQFEEKNIIDNIMNLNLNMKLDQMKFLFTMTNDVINDLKLKQSEVASKVSDYVFDSSLLFRLRNLTKMLTSNCKQTKSSLDFYEQQLLNDVNLTSDFEQEIENKENEVNSIKKTIDKDILSPKKKIICIENIDKIDETLSEDNENSKFENNSIAQNKPTDSETDGELINDSTEVVFDNASANSSQFFSNFYKNKKFTSKINLTTTREAEETMFFNLCLRKNGRIYSKNNFNPTNLDHSEIKKKQSNPMIRPTFIKKMVAEQYPVDTIDQSEQICIDKNI